MRTLVFGLPLVGLAYVALAQQALPATTSKTVKLDLPVDSVMLIVDTLGQIGCQKVADMATCELARDTLRAIQEQAKAQGN